MKPSSWILILLLVILHQDYWNWSSSSLWFGFLPVQLGYHIIVSVLAAACWWWLVQTDWPEDGETAAKGLGE